MGLFFLIFEIDIEIYNIICIILGQDITKERPDLHTKKKICESN